VPRASSAAELVFARRFLEDLAEWQGSASSHDIAALDAALAQIANNPALPGRFPSFYDPTRPSYLYRSGALLIHYRVGLARELEFLNLFYARV
jgi:hypothetical protein